MKQHTGNASQVGPESSSGLWRCDSRDPFCSPRQALQPKPLKDRRSGLSLESRRPIVQAGRLATSGAWGESLKLSWLRSPGLGSGEETNTYHLPPCPGDMERKIASLQES